jgi:DNA-nicking Smr family endonuclease
MSRDGKRRVLSYDERVLWKTITQSIEPLRETPPVDVDIDSETAEPPKPQRTSARPAKTSAVVAPAPSKPVPPPLTPLGRRMTRRVARSKEAIDGRLDLHGYTQAEAHTAVQRFLQTAAARDARLVLVITGKSGVLKRQVPQWLALPELRALVIGFEDAHITHGGEGALYVRLRRNRS